MDPPHAPPPPPALTPTASDSQSFSDSPAGPPPLDAHHPATRHHHRPLPPPVVVGDVDIGGDGALLPRHTLVLVQGNARTKPGLVGMRGRVRRAVGLGGWHWLVLENGEEVRLQRNALAVLEPPTGDESDFTDDDDADGDGGAGGGGGGGGAPGGGLPRVRARRPPRELAGHAVGSRRSGVRHPVGSVPRINFARLETAALKRYRRFYRLPDPAGPNPSKEQLAAAVTRHFASHTVDEAKVIAMFVAAARRAATEGGAAVGAE